VPCTPTGLVDQDPPDLEIDEDPGILGSQATEKECAGRTVGIGVLSAMAPRETFKGVGVGRKARSEAGEAVRRGHFFNVIVGREQVSKSINEAPPLSKDPLTAH
jgi:hypothetical protein